MNRLDEIETLIAVVETGSLTAAARRLNLAVSAVSRRLSDLEARLGVRLVNRSTRSLSLTDVGESYFQNARCVVADLDEADALASKAQDALSGTLKLAAPLSFGLTHLGAVIADFAEAYPNVVLDLDLSDRRVDLIAEGYDLALRIGRLEDSTLKARRLFSVRMVVAASPEYWARVGAPTTPQDLADLDGLHYLSERDGVWRYVGPDGKKGQVRLGRRMCASNGDILVDAAVAGLGVTYQPSFLLSDAVRTGELTPVLTDYTWRDLSAYAVYPPGKPPTERARRLIDVLAERFKDPPAWDKAIWPDA